jgi:hypothetical protein
MPRPFKTAPRPRMVLTALGVFTLTGIASFLGASNEPTASAQSTRFYDIERAAQILISSRGIDYLERSFPTLLERKGVNLQSGALPEFSYTSPTALNLSQLPARFQPYSRTLQQLRSALTEWLTNFPGLRDPRFAVSIRNSSYQVDSVGVNLQADLEATAALNRDGRSQGVIFNLDVNLPHVRIAAESVRGRDLNNSFLGSFGLNRAWIEAGDQDEPLNVHVVVRVRIKRDGGIEFETLGVSTNIGSLVARVGYQRPLVLPRVVLRIGDREMPLDTREIERAFVRKQSELVRMAQLHLKDFIEEEVPKKIDGILYSKIREGFRQEQQVGAPGTDPFGGRRPLAWGLKANGLSASNGLIKLDLAGYVDDPTVSYDDSPSIVRPREPMQTGRLDPQSFDLAFGISIDVLNRALRKGFERGGLSQIDLGDGVPMSLSQTPYILTDLGNGNDASLLLRLRRNTQGFSQSALLDNPFEFETRLTIQARKMNCGTAFGLYANSVQTYNSRVLPQYILGIASVQDIVNYEVGKVFEAKRVEYERNAKELARDIGVPTELFGIPLRISRIQWNAAGYLVLFMNFTTECQR